MSEHLYSIRISESCVDPNALMVERQDPDNFTRFQTQERCALEIAAYVFKLILLGKASVAELSPSRKRGLSVLTLQRFAFFLSSLWWKPRVGYLIFSYICRLGSYFLGFKILNSISLGVFR